MPHLRLTGAAIALVVSSSACSQNMTGMEGERLVAEVMFVGAPGLASHYPDDRQRVLGAELLSSHADVICLGGMWDAERRQDVIREIGAAYPHSLVLPTNDATAVNDPRDRSGTVPVHDDDPACRGEAREALDASLGCLVPCTTDESSSSALVADACLRVSPCANDVDRMRQPDDPRERCRTCFLSHVRAGTPLAEIEERCTTIPGNPKVHQGHHGLVLLSRMPLSEPSLHVLPSETHRRVVLSARATTAAGSEVAVFCATLGHEGEARVPGDPLPSALYVGPYGEAEGGWAIEHELQVDKMLTHVRERAQGGPALVLGNFGSTQAVEEDGDVVIVGAAESVTTRLAYELRAAVPEGHVAECTICPENPLAQRQEQVEIVPTWLNRIYVSEHFQPRRGARAYLGLVVNVEPATHLGLTPVARLPLSAQYAFRTELELIR